MNGLHFVDAVLFNASWRAACSVRVVPRSSVNWMIEKHYLGRWPGVCVLVLGAYLGRSQEPFGVVVYALPPRETSKRYGGATWELARLWLEDDIPKNAETWLIGQSVRYIKRQRPDVRFLVSYADPSVGHAGTIYRAANWQEDGKTDDKRKTPRFDYGDARTGKRYSRRCHVPLAAVIERIPRVSKHRFFLALGGH